MWISARFGLFDCQDTNYWESQRLEPLVEGDEGGGGGGEEERAVEGGCGGDVERGEDGLR